MAGKLNPRQAIFYGEYIKDRNATRAAIAAGYPESSAHVAGARLLRNAKVAAAVDAWRTRTCEKLELTAELVVGKLVAALRADPKNLYDADGNLIPVHKLDDVTRAAIAGVEDEVTKTDAGAVTRNQRVKFADPLRAAELGGKYLKLFTDKIEHSGRLTLEQVVCGESGGGTSDPAHS